MARKRVSRRTRRKRVSHRPYRHSSYRMSSAGRYMRPPSDRNIGKVLMYKGIGLPETFLTKLKYTQTFSLTAGIGSAYQQYQFRGNGPYDPDYTGGGGQPTYYDDVLSSTGPWRSYLCYASKIVLRFSAVGDTYAIGNADICVTPSNVLYSGTAWVDIDDQIDMSQSKKTSVTRMDGSGVKYIKHYAKTGEMFQVSKSTDLSVNQGAFASLYNTVPVAQWYWIISAQGMDRTSTTMNVGCRAEVTYYIKCFDRYEAAQS